VRCAEPGCGRQLPDDRDLCGKCRRRRLDSIDLGDELVAIGSTALYGVLYQLDDATRRTIRRALRGQPMQATA
jgi:hypothetical protein